MTIKPMKTTVYCARQRTRDGKEYVGLGFTYTEALINCLKQLRYADRDMEVSR